MPDHNPQPKLFTAKSFAIAILAVLTGSSLSIIQEFRKTGTVSGITIGASIAAFILGLVIIILIARYANKPEK